VLLLVVHAVDGAGVAPDAPLMQSGLDSLGAVEFRSTLESRLSLQLPPTLVSLLAVFTTLPVCFSNQVNISDA
jgi:acyl carrier protein